VLDGRLFFHRRDDEASGTKAVRHFHVPAFTAQRPDVLAVPGLPEKRSYTRKGDLDCVLRRGEPHQGQPASELYPWARPRPASSHLKANSIAERKKAASCTARRCPSKQLRGTPRKRP